MEAALVFAVQYVYILLLGLQSLNVNQGRYIAAAATSALLGVGGFYITSVIGAAKNMELSMLWWCFVAAGPAGIVTAMRIHPLLVKITGGR